MADYVLRGTQTLLGYIKTLGTKVDIADVASALNIPIQKFSGAGLPGSSYVSSKYNEAQAQSLSNIIGAANVAAVTANAGQEIVG